MKLLAIETSCDETCAAVLDGTAILSNVVWSQIDLHKEFGGVVPGIAKRAHQDKIDWVINKALKDAGVVAADLEAIAVTVGPGLAIALEVGIATAKELTTTLKLPLIAVNHIEGHVLSPLAAGATISFPAMALIVSGKHTELILVKSIGDYQIVARTVDDALGEALDKAARMLGLGYPGGAELEKLAKDGNPKAYKLPIPMLGKEYLHHFSYSGLKTAFYRLVNSAGEKSKADLAAAFQDRAFIHLVRITEKVLQQYPVKDLLVGGGVAANQNLRNRLQALGDKNGLNVYPPAKGLYGDNAAMIGLAAAYKAGLGEFVKDLNAIDRLPRWPIDQAFIM